MKDTDPNPPGSALSTLPSGNRSNELSLASVWGKSHSKNEPREGPLTETDQTSSEDGDLERAPTAHDEQPPAQGVELATVSTAGPVHSVFTKNQKRFIVVMASFGGFFSPVSASIYFPVLNSLAQDLGVTSTLINLTLTSYMVYQLINLPCRRCAHKAWSDLSRPRAFRYWKSSRQRWSTSGLHNMFCHLHWCQHRPRSAEQLCCSFRASLHTEFWQQWYYCPLQWSCFGHRYSL